MSIIRISAAAVAILLFALGSPAATASETRPSDPGGLAARALVDLGNPARLHRVFAKARRGEPVTLGFIGGSITQGAKATRPERQYTRRLATWWQRRFPRSAVKVVNAGVSGTNSTYGAARARIDLLRHEPDLVVVDYTVNDGWRAPNAEAYEGLLRQILGEPQRPAVMLLFMMWHGGGNMQKAHARIGRHYALPMVSYRDALWPEIKSGRRAWAAYMADGVHPTDLGHGLTARFLEHALETAEARTSQQDKASAIPQLPSPILSENRFEHVALRRGQALAPIAHRHWQKLKPDGWMPSRWSSDHIGARISFPANGRAVAIGYRASDRGGTVIVKIDGKECCAIDMWSGSRWGHEWLQKVIPLPGNSTRQEITFEVAPDRNPSSTGRHVEIVSIADLGLTNP